MWLSWRKPVPSHPHLWSLRALSWVIPVALALIWAHQLHKGTIVAAADLRTAVIKRGDFVRSIHISGSTEAVHAYVVQAPQLAGGGSRMMLVHVAHAGTRLRKDDVLAEFDQQDQLKQFRDRQAEYLDSLDKIKKQQAENAIDLAKDQTALEAAEDDYQKAKLEMTSVLYELGLAHALRKPVVLVSSNSADVPTLILSDPRLCDADIKFL